MLGRKRKLYAGSFVAVVAAGAVIAPAAWGGSSAPNSAPSYAAMQSAGYATNVGTAGGDAGVLQAEAAGIRIDPAAIQMMEVARRGSCLNDPMQTKCGPPPTAIVWQGGSSYGPTITSGGAGTTTTAATTTNAGTTTTTGAAPASNGGATPAGGATPDDTPVGSAPCHVYADALQLNTGLHNSEYMYSAGHTYCGAGVTTQEIDLVLSEFWVSKQAWYAEGGSNSEGGPGYLYAEGSSTDCTSNSTRYWKVVVVGTAKYNGTWYLGSDTKGPDWFSCVV